MKMRDEHSKGNRSTFSSDVEKESISFGFTYEWKNKWHVKLKFKNG